jgi:hypothetical protein
MNAKQRRKRRRILDDEIRNVPTKWIPLFIMREYVRLLPRTYYHNQLTKDDLAWMVKIVEGL